METVLWFRIQWGPWIRIRIFQVQEGKDDPQK
jgi:hypothetical protein